MKATEGAAAMPLLCVKERAFKKDALQNQLIGVRGEPVFRYLNRLPILHQAAVRRNPQKTNLCGRILLIKAVIIRE